LIYNLWGWNDYVTLVLAQDRSLLDYVHDYWKKFMKHLNESPEGSGYRETWEAYPISMEPDKSFYKSMGILSLMSHKMNFPNLGISSMINTHVVKDLTLCGNNSNFAHEAVKSYEV
jgi:hypothetical protein